MNLEKARKEYKKGNISFKELDKIFFQNSNDKQLDVFWSAPVFDRPGVIIGKNKAQRDLEFNKIINK